MGTRFTRVTVIGDGRRVDVSLPADAPLAEQLPAVLRLLSVPTARVPVRWRLSAPEFGELEPGRSLDEIGVLDGARLQLTEAAKGPLPPHVDDVESAAATQVAAVAVAWSGAARRSAIGALSTPVLLAGLLLGLGAASPVSWIAPAAVLLAAIAMAATVRERGGWCSALVAVPAAVALLIGVVDVRLSPPDGLPAGSPDLTGSLTAVLGTSVGDGFALAVAALAAAAITVVAAVRGVRVLVVAGAGLTVAAVAALACTRWGLPPDRTAALSLVAALLLSGSAGRLAVGGAGLVDLLQSDERGEPVLRDDVADAVQRGISTAAGLLWAACIVAAPACVVLVVTPPESAGWVAPAIGVLGGLIFGVRSRMFTRAQHVGPMLGVVVLSAVAVARELPLWCGMAPALASSFSLLLLGVVLSAVRSGVADLPQVAGARWQRALDGLESIAVLALVPGVVLLFDVIPLALGWWG